MNDKRRVFLRSTLSAGVVGVAVGAGLLSPRQLLAAWPKDAFGSDSADGAMSALLGSTDHTDSGQIAIKAPDIAENGAVVPITVSTDLPKVESVTIIAENNPSPLAASFNLGEGAEGFISTRIKMGKTSNVLALVKSEGTVFASRKEVKVTIGGCGG